MNKNIIKHHRIYLKKTSPYTNNHNQYFKQYLNILETIQFMEKRIDSFDKIAVSIFTDIRDIITAMNESKVFTISKDHMSDIGLVTDKQQFNRSLPSI